MNIELLHHGWLLASDLPSEVNGVHIPIETRTRREEYTLGLALAPAEPGDALDVATGFMPEWHLFALILARAGWTVDAFDSNPLIRDLPAHDLISYFVADATAIPCPSDAYDYVTCISTLEHMSRRDQIAAADEMIRCCAPGGTILATADFAPWLPEAFGFSVAPVGLPSNESLLTSPPVYYALMRKVA